jgi:hypothetical protein
MLSLALALALSQVEPAEPPPETRLTPPAEAPAPPSVVTRTLLSTGGGALAGAAGLGIAMLLVGANPNFDAVFATAALSALLITGVSFTLHQALGGNGEITLAFLGCALLVAGATGLALAINPSRDIAPYLLTAIGSIPAAAGAVIALEGTTPQAKPKPRLAIAFNGVYGTF